MVAYFKVPPMHPQIYIQRMVFWLANVIEGDCNMPYSTGNGTVPWELDTRGVATVTLNRPHVNNAYNGDLIRGVHEAMNALGGERFGAHEAHRIGLVHEVCPAAELEAASARIVDALLMTAPNATTATKLRSRQVSGAFIDDGLFQDLVREHAATRQLAEAAEGLASFREKRKPGWYPAAGWYSRSPPLFVLPYGQRSHTRGIVPDRRRGWSLLAYVELVLAASAFVHACEFERLGPDPRAYVVR